MTGHDIDNTQLPLQALFGMWPPIVGVFLSHRMLCFGCPIAPFHTVGDACSEYKLDEITFRAELNAAISAARNKVTPPDE